MFKTAFTEPAMSPVTSASAGTGGKSVAGWEPTTLYMTVLVIVEIVALGWLSNKLLK